MKTLQQLSNRMRGAIQGFIRAGDYVQTDEGLIIHSGIRIRGRYLDTVNGKDEQESFNLLVDQGILFILEASLGDLTTNAQWWLAPYQSNQTPASDWTAANWRVGKSADEITDPDEGYSESTRQEWVAGVAGSGKISNLASRAVHTIAVTTPLTIYGAALLSNSTKGDDTGTLMSAVKFSTARVVNDTDSWELAYEVELTDS